jgi:hypothetical protein
MPKFGEQGDVLRALGRAVDEQGGRDIAIEARDGHLAVSYRVGAAESSSRYYQDYDLDALRAKAQFLRTGGAGAARAGALAELLRTLGQELDEAGIEWTAVAQTAEGFRVSGVWHGQYHTQHVFRYELESSSAQRRAARGAGGGRPAEEIDPFVGVSVGAPVVTRDRNRLGKVGAVSGRSLEVKTPVFHRDFWVSDRYVASARPGGPVVLSVAKAELRVAMQNAPERLEEGRILAPAPRADAWY